MEHEHLRRLGGNRKCYMNFFKGFRTDGCRMVGCQLVILSFDRGKLHICWREDGQKSLLVERSKSYLGDDVHENIIEKENFQDNYI